MSKKGKREEVKKKKKKKKEISADVASRGFHSEKLA